MRSPKLCLSPSWEWLYWRHHEIKSSNFAATAGERRKVASLSSCKLFSSVKRNLGCWATSCSCRRCIWGCCRGRIQTRARQCGSGRISAVQAHVCCVGQLVSLVPFCFRACWSSMENLIYYVTKKKADLQLFYPEQHSNSHFILIFSSVDKAVVSPSLKNNAFEVYQACSTWFLQNSFQTPSSSEVSTN